MRRCEILCEGRRWRELSVSDLRPGDVFRMFEASGRPVEDAEGCRRWRCLSPPRPRSDEGGEYAWDVDAEPVPETDAEREARETGVYWPGDRRPLGRSRLRP